MALLAITTEARHAKKTKPMGNAKMVALIEKMKHRVPIKATDDDDDDCSGMMCPGDWCCTDADLTCCEEESPYVCAEDPDVCDDCPGQKCDGGWCCPYDDWTCCDEDSPYICTQDGDQCDDANMNMNPLLMKMRRQNAAKTPIKIAKVEDDCEGQMCPGDWCCPDASLTCCDEDSDYICVEDPDTC